MATNEERIRLVVEGLNQLDQLKNKLAAVTNSLNALEEKAKSVTAGTRQTRGILRGIQEDVAAERPGALSTRFNVQQRRNTRGRFLPGPNVNARRLAEEQLDFLSEIRGRAQRGQRDLAAREIAAKLRATAERRTAEIVEASLDNAEREVDQRLRKFANESVAKRASTRVGRGLDTINRVRPDTSATGKGQKLTAAEREKANELIARTEEIRALAEPLRANVKAGKATRSQVNVLQKYAAELESLGEGFREIDRLVTLRSTGIEKARRVNERFAALEQPSAAFPGGRTIKGAPAIGRELIAAANAGNFEKFKRLSTAADRYAARLERETGEANKFTAANEKLSRATVSLATQREKALAAQAEFDNKFRKGQGSRSADLDTAIRAADNRLEAIREGRIFEGLGVVKPPKPISGKTLADFDKRLAEAGGNRAKALEEYNATIRKLNEQVAASYKRWEDAVDNQAKAVEGLGSRGGRVRAFRNTDAFERRVERNAQRRRDAEISLGRQQVREEAKNAAAERRMLKERFSKRLSTIASGAIGGGFPLLFGQGAGAGLGGAVGGLLGGALGGSGGFAGGIVGSLIGTQFDKLKASAIGLAEALREPSKLLDAMAAAGITTSSALKNTVAALESTGRAAEAQQLVFAELEKLGGTDYVQNLLELEESNKALQDQWSQLSVAVQKELLPWFIEFTNAATVLAGVLKTAAPLLKVIGPVLEAAFTAANQFGALSLIKNLAGVVAGPGGVKRDDSKTRTPQLGDTEQRKAIDEAVTRQKEAIDLARQGASLERDAADYRRDQDEAIAGFRRRVADYERDITEFRRGLEDKIFDKRQQVLRAEAELLRKQSQVAIERSDLSLSIAGRIPSAQGGGKSQLVDAAREYLRTRAEGEADLQQKEKESKLKIADIQRETTKFEQDVTKKIVDLRKVAEDYKRDVDKFAYDTAKKVYDYQIKAADYQYAMWERGYKLAVTAQEKMAVAANGMNPYGPVGAVDVGGGSFQMSRMDFIKWMRTQGFERTSGDFTNAGHRTPNHMLNAIDMGILGGSDSEALRRTAEMERRLAATGSFGTQLFGPIRDPYGHGAGRGGQNIHLHIPSPGGMVNINPALAELMGLGRTPGKGGAATAMPSPGAMPTVPTLAPMGTPPRMGAVPNFNAETEKFNELQQRSIDLANRDLDVERDLAKARMDAAQAGLEEKTAAIFQQLKQPLLDANQQLKDRAAYEREYSGLLANGTLPALAEQLAVAGELERTQLRLLKIEEDAVNAAIAKTEALIKGNTLKGEELRLEEEALKVLKSRRDAIPGARSEINALGAQNRELAIQAESPEARRQRTLDEYNRRKNEREDVNRPFDQYMKAKADLEDLIDPLNQVMSATDALGNAFGDAFRSIIDGSESADQALKKMFANIGSYFLNMATQILAQQAMTSILGLFAGGASAATGGGGNGFLTGGLFNTQFSYAGGGYTGDGARSGGVDGQGGFPAILHPQETVIDHTMPRPALRPAGEYGLVEPTTPEITYSGAVLNFNGNEYVSKADVPKIIAASTAATGAKMRNSVSYRKRTGI